MGPTLVQVNKDFDYAMQSTFLRWGQHLYKGTKVKQINQLVFVIEISVGVVFVIEISVGVVFMFVVKTGFNYKHKHHSFRYFNNKHHYYRYFNNKNH